MGEEIFPQIDEEAMKRGLEETLKHLINQMKPEAESVKHTRVGDIEYNSICSSKLNHLLLTYKFIREVAHEIGFDTRDYDLTCARAVEGVETCGYKDGKPGRIPVAPVFLGGIK